MHIAVTGEVPTHQLSVGDTCSDFTFVALFSVQIQCWVWTPFSFSSTSTKIHTVCSLKTFSSTDWQEFTLPLGTDPILFRPTQDLAGEVGQGQELSWELQGRLSGVSQELQGSKGRASICSCKADLMLIPTLLDPSLIQEKKFS